MQLRLAARHRGRQRRRHLLDGRHHLVAHHPGEPARRRLESRAWWRRADLHPVRAAHRRRRAVDRDEHTVRGWDGDRRHGAVRIRERLHAPRLPDRPRRSIRLVRSGPDRERQGGDADVVVTDQGIVYGDVASVNRRAILVTITAYGTTGPLGWVRGSDLEVTAASGSLWLAGEPGRTPVRTTLPQSPFWTGMYAAMGALLALSARERTGRGQHVDVSAQAAMATVHPPAIVFWKALAEEHRRLGPFLIGRSIVGAKFRNIWPCADGYVAFAVQGGPIGRHTGRMLAEWMRERGALDEIVAAIDWDTFDNRTLRQEDVDRLEASIASFMLTLSKREFFDGVIARNMLGYPVADARDIFADAQLWARDFWQDLALEGRRTLFPGGFALLDGRRPQSS